MAMAYKGTKRLVHRRAVSSVVMGDVVRLLKSLWREKSFDTSC